MAAPIAFESSHVKDLERQQLRKAREKILEKAQSDYEHRERRKRKAKEQGEDTWMLDSVSQRVDRDQQLLDATKKSKKKKKEKKKLKKEKKKKSKKHKKKSDSESSSDSDGSEDEPVWVEKGAAPSAAPAPAASGPKLQREDWMSAPPDFFPAVSRDELRQKARKEQEEIEQVKKLLEQPGQHERELNPFWKDGGSGLPEEEKKEQKTTFTANIAAGDAGLSWWRKKYQRCVEQAEEEGKTLEEVAAHSYGSLEYLKSMLAEAEKTNKDKKELQYEDRLKRRYGDRFRSREERDRREDRDRPRDNSPVRRDSSNKKDTRDYRRDKNKSPDHRRDRSKSKSPDYRRHRDRSRERDKSRERRNRDYKDSRDRDCPREDRTNHGDRSRTKDYESHKSLSHNKLKSMSSRFMKPSDRSSERTSSHGSGRKYESESAPRWKKKEYIQPKEETTCKKQDEERKETSSSRRRKQSTSSESESSSSSSSESEEEASAGEAEKQEPVAVTVLTEEQMNQLGAKILRAEIMGDEELASKLKSELDAARKVRESAPPPSTDPSSRRADQDSTVILTRTDRAGNVRPLEAQKHAPQHGNARRRKEKAATHSKSGERDRYFADDDKFSLKDLVAREKLGTAEDQNAMFSRLAGRSTEKTDDDFAVDDIFISKANRKQSEAQEEEKQKGLAILEHRKLAKAMESCPHCFDNVSKHLIVAIGIKVYLCLPNHKSMSDGHCLIIPMQHVSAATAADEDVWDEIKVFKKGLTKMYEDHEEDVVFMETSTKLKNQHHMVIESVPMPRETGDLAPIYFKKAILDAGEEWAQNKKLVDLKGRDIRRAVPKGFPYFTVDFGLQPGFAHVIEDDRTFPSYFGREIVGGMLDLEPTLWRKPQREKFEEQRQKVLQFADIWKPYDWTQRLKDSSS